MQAEIFGSIFVISQRLDREADAALERLDLTTKQWLLLAVLKRAFPDGAPTLSEAALQYGSTRQNVKQIALQLEARGFLRIVPDPSDRRILRLKLTKKLSIFDTAAEQARQAAFLEEAFGELSEKDLRSLGSLLQRLLIA